MRKSIFFYKELTPAEVGKTGTHEVYVRLPNNFDYESFFGDSAVQNGSVMEVNFTAQDITIGGEKSTPLRFVYFKNSNQEKRIPSLGPLFKSHNVQEGDIVCLESRIDGTSYSYYLCFYKKGEIQVNPAAVYFSKIEKDPTNASHNSNIEQSLQQIFYGAPGTGKSHIIKEQTKGEDVIRTTFHPDTDYSTFVGTYKPTTEFAPVLAIIGDKAVETGREEKRISYEFVCQPFLQAYVAAWKKVAEAKGSTAKKQFLVIEEINRGNCAQIFGDLFQLLDRNDFGYSDYPIKADADMQKQLKRLFEGVTITDADSINAMYDGRDIVKEVLSGEVLLLPNNLYIWATMNTSDQSLFPIDSAFKRRWDWQYMPISDGGKQWVIEIGSQKYSWWSFIQKINNEIYEKTNSEDKKLGYYFCKPINGVIKVETFVSKVLFYLWNDVFKDFEEDNGLFVESYDKFYMVGMDGKAQIVEGKVELLLQNLGVELFIEDEDYEDETNGRVRYIINGDTFKRKSYAGKEIMSRYLKGHPNMTFKEIKETFPDNMLVHSGHRGLVVSADTPLDSYERYYSPERYSSSDGVTFRIYKQWTSANINNIINFAINQGWDIKVEELDGQEEQTDTL